MLNIKFVKKYMRLAKQVGEDLNPCHSRKIGVVLVHPTENKILGTGYNGPPRNTPHCDSREYLENYFWPQLTELDHTRLRQFLSPIADLKQSLVDKYTDSGTCPRKIIGCKSGERLELCSCQHAERNAIYNSSSSLLGAWAFCWCSLPCQDCAGALINVRVARVYCLAGPDYSPNSRKLFEAAGVEVYQFEEDYFKIS